MLNARSLWTEPSLVAARSIVKNRTSPLFPWVSSNANDFNYDFHVTLDPKKDSTVYNYETVDWKGEFPGLSVFLREGERIFHTYSTYMRGLDIFMSPYHLLDVTPMGRNEDKPMSWVKYHDEYAEAAPATCC